MSIGGAMLIALEGDTSIEGDTRTEGDTRIEVDTRIIRGTYRNISDKE